jgi:hypothetical protein
MEAEKKTGLAWSGSCWRADMFIGLSTDMSAEMYIQIMKKTYWMTEILATLPNKQYPTIWNYMYLHPIMKHAFVSLGNLATYIASNHKGVSPLPQQITLFFPGVKTTFSLEFNENHEISRGDSTDYLRWRYRVSSMDSGDSTWLFFSHHFPPLLPVKKNLCSRYINIPWPDTGIITLFANKNEHEVFNDVTDFD